MRNGASRSKTGNGFDEDDDDDGDVTRLLSMTRTLYVGCHRRVEN